MNVREVFCIDCYEWRKREDLVESQQHTGELYCAECGAVLIRTEKATIPVALEDNEFEVEVRMKNERI